ncbi:MAG: response regulator transcription factor [Pyrinomonadaceae bacterium]
MKVILADDHTIVRHGLRQLLEKDKDITVVGEAANGNEVFELLRVQKVDVIVLDISMPGRNGLETLKDLRRLYPQIPVIMLSMHPSDQYAVRVLKAGAVAYLTKESAPSELADAIRKVYTGEKYITAEVGTILADFVGKGTGDEPHKALSDREFEVFCLIGAGNGLTQIASRMNLSVKTISTYRTRIIEKTRLANNAEITRYAIQHGLV